MKIIKTTVNGQLSRKDRKYLGKRLKSLKLQIAKNIILMASINAIIKGQLGLKKGTRDGTFLTKAKAIQKALIVNSGGYYTPPFTDMSLLETQIVDFERAILNVSMRVLGAAGAKTAAKTMLMSTLMGVLDFVNNLARLNQLFAVEIITGATLLVNGMKGGGKDDFAVRQGVTTEVILDSKAVMDGDKYVKASYDWQRSIDGGLTWIDLPSTQVAKTSVMGLDLGDQSFRKRTNSKKAGITVWCKPIVFQVL